MKTSKIKSVDSKVTPWDKGKGGTIYYRDIELDNGDVGSIGTKEESPSWLAAGKSLNYNTEGDEPPYKIKKENPKPNAAAASAPKAKVSNTSEWGVPLTSMLFISIESVGKSKSYSSIKDAEMKKNFDTAFGFYTNRFEGMIIGEAYTNAAGAMPEFCHIVSICIGYIKDGEMVNKTMNLKEARDAMNVFYDKGYTLVGHNLKGFVLPLIGKKCLIEGIKPPKFTPIANEKPWDVRVIDTKGYYQFGDNYGLSAREFISHSAGIEIGTEIIKGSEIHNLYWSKKLTKELVDKSATKKNEWLYKFVKYVNELK